MYDQSVGRNCNLVIGAVINPQGLVPVPDVQRLEAFGAAIRRRFRHPVAETGGSDPLVTLGLPRSDRIDQAVLQEDISLGERVRKYSLEGLTEADTWETLGSGECIGHKAILRFDPGKVSAVRLRVPEYIAEPRIRKMAVFRTE